MGKTNRAPAQGCEKNGTCSCNCGNDELRLPGGTLLKKAQGCKAAQLGRKGAKHCNQHRANCHLKCKP